MPRRVIPVERISSWEAQLRAMERDWVEISGRRTRALLADLARSHAGEALEALEARKLGERRDRWPVRGDVSRRERGDRRGRERRTVRYRETDPEPEDRKTTR